MTEKIYESNDLGIAFGVEKVQRDGDSNGLDQVVHFFEQKGKTILSMSKTEWLRLCDLSILDRDVKIREAYFKQAKAYQEMQQAVVLAVKDAADKIAVKVNS